MDAYGPVREAQMENSTALEQRLVGIHPSVHEWIRNNFDPNSSGYINRRFQSEWFWQIYDVPKRTNTSSSAVHAAIWFSNCYTFTQMNTQMKYATHRTTAQSARTTWIHPAWDLDYGNISASFDVERSSTLTAKLMVSKCAAWVKSSLKNVS